MGILNSIVDIGGSLLGAGVQYYGAKKAADAQEDASEAALDFQRETIGIARADQQPWRDLGQNSLYQLASGLGTEYAGAPGTVEDRYATALDRFQTGPGYQFAMDQGTEAIEQSQSGRGLLQSGNTGTALTQYGQGLANQEWQGHQNRLAALAGLGQTATGQTGSLGITGAGLVGNQYNNAGQASASGYIGQTNAINKGLQNLASVDFSTLYNSGGSGAAGVPGDFGGMAIGANGL